MLVEALKAGFQDELRKISADISGLSPETVSEHMLPAPPMETNGLSKALEILRRADTVKTASSLMATVPGQNPAAHLTKKDPKDSPFMSQGKSFGAHALGGMGAGRLLSEFERGPKNVAKGVRSPYTWHAMAAGAALGAAEFGRKKLRDRMAAKKMKTSAVAAVASPGAALRASRQVGRISTGVRKSLTPSLKSQNAGATIGRKFRTA